MKYIAAHCLRELAAVGMVVAGCALAGCPGMPMPSSDNTDSTANRAPSVVITTGKRILAPSDRLEITVLDTVFLSAAGSSDPDSDPLSFAWDFGDGSTSSDLEIAHQYNAMGEYTIRLTCTDPGSLSAIRNIPVTVSSAPPEARFVWEPIVPETDAAVSFDASSSDDGDGEIVSYDWDFGDGTTATGQTVEHTFSDEGSFDVTLTVTDNDGNSSTDINQVLVLLGNQPPVAVAGAEPTVGVAPVDIQFTGSLSTDPEEGVLSYVWDFGDGGTSTEPDPVHTFDTPADHVVSLTVTDDEGLSDTATVDVEILEFNAAPTAVIEADPPSGLAPLTVQFDGTQSSDAEDGTNVAYLWDFGDGLPQQTGAAPSHVFTSGGIYDVSLTVYDFLGEPSDPAIQTITVSEVVSLSVSPTSVELELDGTQQLEVTATLDDATTMDVTASPQTLYFTSASSVTIVDETGLITAITEGMADITVSRSDPGVPSIVVPVTVTAGEALEVNATATLADPEDHYAAVGAAVMLDAVTSGGVGDPDTEFTYDWDLVSVPASSALTKADFVNGDTAESSLTPDVEGFYQVLCRVTDLGGEPVESNVVVFVASADSTTLQVNANSDSEPDTCIVGIPSDVIPNGGDAPPSATDDNVVLTTGLGATTGMTLLWSATPDSGTFGDATIEDAVWTVPFVNPDTDFTFTLDLTDTATGATAFFATTVPVTRASELSDICEAPASLPCPAVDLTHSLVEGPDLIIELYYADDVDTTDLTGQLSRVSGPDTVVIDPACDSDPYVDGQECTLTFVETGTYQFRVITRNDVCTDGQSSSGPKQRIQQTFTVEVSN